jgi:putative SOS response-associated peptidase YedK
LQPHFNIAPTTTIDAIIEKDGKRDLLPMRWGLIPSWWNKTAKETPATFNGQSDTVATKPMFPDIFKKRRCLILMSGYYEWINAPDGKQPFYFCAKDGELLTAAGLWDEWLDPVSGARLWREGEPQWDSRHMLERSTKNKSRFSKRRCCEHGKSSPTPMTFPILRSTENSSLRALSTQP